MKITLLGMGCGTAETLTIQGRRALTEAQFIVGSQRLLAALPAGCTSHRACATKAQEILALLEGANCETACVVYSGDTGFYSGARSLLPLLAEHQAVMLPGISSVQALAAALGLPWQDWKLVSAHGQDCDAVAEVMQGRPVLFLTSGGLGTAELCRQLAGSGLGELPVTVGENLTCPNQRVLTGTAAGFAEMTFAPLCVLLAAAAPVMPRRTAGWPDEEFLRVDQIPMTKQEVRAAALAKLAVAPHKICWDIGAGTGSVSVELAAQCRTVWAVEQKPEAAALLRRNREKFHAYNLHLVEDKAPAALAALPKPDAVFVGGSGGALGEILRAVHAANPAARVCVTAIALETLHTACEVLDELGYAVEAEQISVSRAKPAGRLHLLMAQNPVFLITGVRP